MTKEQGFMWAASVIREHVDKDSFGTCTVSMANGKISAVKCEINHKAPVDEPNKNQ